VRDTKGAKWAVSTSVETGKYGWPIVAKDSSKETASGKVRRIVTRPYE
jgi:hypothetical protein